MTKITCLVDYCEHNNKKTCLQGKITLDYMGIDAMPTCLGFVRKAPQQNENVWSSKEDKK